tara:strand:+ start:1271 stop:2584 length:1314 start_codon:yes stop_codon:yes gene_type:complete
MLDKSDQKKTAITFLSGSAGELDWVLPILDFLLKKGFDLKIIFLTRHVLKSVKTNTMLNNYISQEHSKIEVILCGGFFWEKLERLSYLSYRLILKLKLDKKPFFSLIYRLCDKFFEGIFLFLLPRSILNLRDEKNLFFNEYPSLRRPRDNWTKKNFDKSLFFYCPHSPHIYAEDLDRQYPESNPIDLNKKNFLLLGHPEDYLAVNDERELASPDLEKIFIGHPKYSNGWLRDLQKTSENFRGKSSFRDRINILILSRGAGSYLDDESHKDLVENTIKVIRKNIPNYNLLIKKHPRELDSHWDNFKNDPSIKIVNNHILDIATKSDFAITYWTSGAMDCCTLGVPVIEYFDPNKHPKQQVYDGKMYTTIYRKLGVVLSASNEKELDRAVLKVVKENYKISSDKPHSFFTGLIESSNQWHFQIEEILLSHNLITDKSYQ